MKTRRTLRLRSFINLVLGLGLIAFLGTTAWKNYRGVSETILAGFDHKLEAISTSAALFISGDEHAAILKEGSEDSDAYKKYASEMKQVMDEAGLTYHYTIVLPKENTLTYVIDGTEGENHSTLGTEEEVDTEEWTRLHDVMLTGIPTQSKVKKFEIWGQLKVGSAPIRNAIGEIVGLAGADVNISIIDQKSRIALLRVLALVALGLIVAGIIASWISRDLGKPIAQLKGAILRMASGDYSNAVVPHGPKELVRLSQVFEQSRRTLEGMVRSLEHENREYNLFRERSILKEILLADQKSSERKSESQFSFQLFISAAPGPNPIAAVVREGDWGIVWIGETKGSELARAWQESDITTTCSNLLRAFSGNANRIERELRGLFLDVASHFIVFNTQTGEVRCASATATRAIREISLSPATKAKRPEHNAELVIHSTEAESDTLLALTLQEGIGTSESAGVRIVRTETSPSGSVTLLRLPLNSTSALEALKAQALSAGGFEHANR